MAEARKAKSPYRRYSKTPFRYSPLLNECAAAVKEGKRDKAEQLAAQHRDRWHGQFLYEGYIYQEAV